MGARRGGTYFDNMKQEHFSISCYEEMLQSLEFDVHISYIKHQGRYATGVPSPS